MTDTVDVEACVRLLKQAQLTWAYYGDADAAEHFDALASALPGIGKDSERLDWLEGEAERERVADQRLNTEPNCPIRFPRSLYRSNMPITREAIDAARAAQPQETSADAE